MRTVVSGEFKPNALENDLKEFYQKRRILKLLFLSQKRIVYILQQKGVSCWGDIYFGLLPNRGFTRQYRGGISNRDTQEIGFGRLIFHFFIFPLTI